MRKSILPGLIVSLAAIAVPAFAQPVSEKPAPAGQAPSDPDAMCVLQSQNAMLEMMNRGELTEGQTNQLFELSNYFAFFSGRLSARHDFAAIAPLIIWAARAMSRDPEAPVNAARRCFAEVSEANLAVNLEFDRALSEPAPAEAPPGPVDPDALCLVTMRGPALAAPNDSGLSFRERREVENAFAYFLGRLVARQPPGTALPSLSAAHAAIPPQPRLGSIERTCIGDAKRVIDAAGEAGIAEG